MSRQVRKKNSSRYSHSSLRRSDTQPREGSMMTTGAASARSSDIGCDVSRSDGGGLHEGATLSQGPRPGAEPRPPPGGEDPTKKRDKGARPGRNSGGRMNRT